MRVRDVFFVVGAGDEITKVLCQFVVHLENAMYNSLESERVAASMQASVKTTVVGCPMVSVVPMTRMPGTRDGSGAAVPLA